MNKLSNGADPGLPVSKVGQRDHCKGVLYIPVQLTRPSETHSDPPPFLLRFPFTGLSTEGAFSSSHEKPNAMTAQNICRPTLGSCDASCPSWEVSARRPGSSGVPASEKMEAA